MASQQPSQNPTAPMPAPSPATKHLDGILDVHRDGVSEKLVDAIEMLGEEKAAGLRPAGHSEVTAGMRYLGGCCAAWFSLFMIRLSDANAQAALPAALIGIAVTMALLALHSCRSLHHL